MLLYIYIYIITKLSDYIFIPASLAACTDEMIEKFRKL